MATIFDLLLSGTSADVQVWSLPNRKGEGDERHIGARSAARLETWVERKDKPGFGTFFCVSTIEHGERRRKEFARELPFLFADVDFKQIQGMSPEEIFTNLKNLDLPPSRIHATGGGYHCFWVLENPVLQDGMDEAERLLRQLAVKLGSDRMVAHRVALLRVPGTYNSKRVGPGEGRGTRTELVWETGEVYALQELAAWLASLRGSEPILPQVPRDEDSNPFTRLAETQELRGPLDVEAALASMEVGFNVHDTQLSCTAALMAAGAEEDDAVHLVLEATKSLEGTDGWDWREEERNIRKMCSDAVKKFGGRDKRQGLTVIEGGGPSGDVPSQSRQSAPTLTPVRGSANLANARVKREDPEEGEDEEADVDPKKRALGKISKKLKNDHVVIGKWILEVLYDQGRALMYTENQAWMYRDGVWMVMTPDEERTWASVMVEQACRAAKLVSTTKLVNETRAWLQREPDLHKEDVDWDGHGCIATKSGLLDWETGGIEEAQPKDYVTRRIECEYDADADCPVWKRMLVEDYQFDEATVAFLQELAGVSLIAKKARTLTRALVLLGQSNTGKSNILNVLAGLICEHHNATELKLVENTHGLMAFLKPHPWVLHEAFEQSRWEMSATTKAILSGDPVNVNIKNGPMVTLKFNQPVFWGSNVAPQFKEASRAMENRLAIVKMSRTFDPMNVTGTGLEAIQKGYRTPAELVLDTEKSGVLNWAIEGLKRAWSRGHFLFTEDMMRSLHQMRSDSNMAVGFLEECCEYIPNSYIHVGDFYGAFTVWHADNRGSGTTPSADSLGRSLGSISDHRVVINQRVNRHRVYAGLRFNDYGLDCWNAFQASPMAERTGFVVSSNDGEVNKTMDEETFNRPEYSQLRALLPRNGEGNEEN